MLETATLALSDAETAARPELNPSVAYTKSERIDDFEVYLAVLAANLVRADIQVTYLEGRLASLDAVLAEPKVSFGTLFSDQGDVALELYFKGLAEDPGNTAWGLGDPRAFAFGAATDFLTGDIVDAFRRDYRPDLLLRVAQAQAEAAEWQLLYDGALVEYATLLVGGVDITIFVSPSEAAVSALVIAQASYDMARAARDAASFAYYVAFDAAVNTVPTEPFCDSRELGVALREFCAQPVPAIDPADEEYPG